MLKRKKWYPTTIKPIWKEGLIIMTDMGYMFEARYNNNIWSLLQVLNHKAYYVSYKYQECVIKWMKV